METFIDSPAKAKEDAKIISFDYFDGEFRTYFTSPFQQYAKRVGEPFTVVRQIQELKLETPEEDGEDDMYLIRFEDGTEIEAWGHEVCILNYDKCEVHDDSIRTK